jgi:hypothetical protein
MGGVPAKLIRKRFSENTIKELQRSRWWTLNDDILKKVGKYMSDAETLINILKELNIEKK